MQIKNLIGPGTIVTAAFIGPGTVTVCTLAGAQFGFSLLWVLVFAVLATIILQEMAARLGLMFGAGLGEALRSQLTNPFLKIPSLILVFLAIVFGNAAYEAGNITGASLGMHALIGVDFPWQLLVAAVVGVLLWFERYQILQYVLTFAVLIMSLVFISVAILLPHDFTSLFSGFIPQLTSQNQSMVLALIGTTIVPYNLFLHASLVSKKWNGSEDLRMARKESAIAIFIGGIISISIVMSASGVYGMEIKSVQDLAAQLEPMMGRFAQPLLSIGLLSAGLTSAITAPLAAVLTAKGLFNWNEKSWQTRSIWIFIVGIGLVFSMLGIQPVSLIKIAQLANGIVLPLVVVFLIAMCNRTTIMGTYRNTLTQNTLAFLVLALAILIGMRGLGLLSAI
jgi:manganese transport protein